MTEAEQDGQEEAAQDVANQANQQAAAPEGPRALTDDGITEEELASPEVQLQAVQGELEVLEDRYLRVRAEYDNYRKRTTGELKSAWNRAQADFVKSLLEALDDLQRVGAWEAGSTTVEALIEGVDLVERKLAQALKSAGVAIVQPEVGSRFDPNSMEAMLRVETEDESQDESVAQVFARGYQLGDNLIRPARVSVFKSD